MPFLPGLTGAAEAVVSDADTAAALGSGDVDCLGTPRALALLEAATVTALASALEPGQTTVGVHVEVDHLLPTPVGARVTAEATLAAVDGRRLVFVVRLADDQGRLAVTGRIVRAVVDRETFAQRSSA